MNKKSSVPACLLYTQASIFEFKKAIISHLKFSITRKDSIQVLSRRAVPEIGIPKAVLGWVLDFEERRYVARRHELNLCLSLLN